MAGPILADEELHAERIPTWRASDREQLTLAGGALLGRDDISDRIGEFGCPAMAFHGTDDRAISLDRAQALTLATPDDRGIVRIEGAAPAPNLTHPVR